MYWKTAIGSVIIITVAFVGQVSAKETINVVSTEGSVKLIKSGTKAGIACIPDTQLESGDWLSVGKASNVVVAFDDARKNLTKIEENTLVEIKDAAPDIIELFNGTIVANLLGLSSGQQFVMRTPSGICGARGTGWMVATDGLMTNVNVYQHDVFFRGFNPDGSLKEEVTIGEGYSCDIIKYGDPGPIRKTDDAVLDALKKTANDLKGASGAGRESAGFGEKARHGIIMVNGVGVNVDIVDRIERLDEENIDER
ncbi:MAG: hypothetical protein PHH49_00430 [Candidatus Omnitrophica bacterium]|nr:hypothetical protein [Candidatus Omnitrophota bacterium]MDD5487419.1 hypothetical protein [Candidatus Omnitrophota bacterium]